MAQMSRLNLSRWINQRASDLIIEDVITALR